jgi:hypothetical protein
MMWLRWRGSVSPRADDVSVTLIRNEAAATVTATGQLAV